MAWYYAGAKKSALRKSLEGIYILDKKVMLA